MGAHTLVVCVTTAPEASGLRRVLRGGAVNVAGAMVGAVLNLALIVAITRAFSQETAGLLFSATSVFLIAAAVATLGASDGLVYFIARMRVLGGTGGVPRLLRLATGPAALAACATAALLVVFTDPLARALGDEQADVYLRLLALFLPFAVLTETALAATRAHHDMTATALLDKTGRPLAQLGLVGVVVVAGSSGLLALAWAGPYLPAAVLAWFWLGRVLRRSVPEETAPEGAVGPDTSGSASRVVVRAEGAPGTPGEPSVRGADGGVDSYTFWSFALPRAAAGVAQMGVQRGGVVLVALLGGLGGAAVFMAATRIMVVGQFGTQAVSYAAQPRFAEQVAAEDHAGVRTLYQVGTAWLVCLVWPLYLSALVFAPEVMRLFGADYSAGAEALVVVCTGQLLAAALGMGDLILTMTGRTRWNLLNNTLSLVSNVLLCVLLIPVAGTTGAAAALVVAVLLRKVLPLWQLRSLVVLHPFSRPVVIAAAGSLVWFGALPSLLGTVLGGGVMTLALAVSVGTAGHMMTLWSLRGPLSLDPRL